MEKSVFNKDILPFVLWLSILVFTTITTDYLLHQFQQVWIGKYLGIPGTIILLFSFLYSLRKRKIIQNGSPKLFLKIHQFLAWIGTLLILIHAGIHFNAVLPWAALVLMLMVFVSGLTGQYILKKARRTLKQRNLSLIEKGFSEEDADRKTFLDAFAVQAMTRWRLVHKPVTILFIVIAAHHINVRFDTQAPRF